MINFKKAALLVHGVKDIYNAKTANSIIKYRLDDVLCYVNCTNTNPNNIFNTNIKVISNLDNSELYKLNSKPDVLILCLVLPEGKLPDAWLASINYALENNIDIINPFHFNLNDYEEISSRFGGLNDLASPEITIFNKTKSKIYNLRISKVEHKLLSLKILEHKPERILTVGTDCNIGKMITTIECNKEMQKKSYKSTWVATGQIGIMLNGNGVCVDRIVSDFLPGVVEDLILKEDNDLDYIFIEGQGSLFQPIYSCVTLGLMHGSAPNYMILCHAADRKKLRYTNIDIPDLKKIIAYYEETASIIINSKIIALSLNTHSLDLKTSIDLITYYENYLNIPVSDPIKFGTQKFINAIINYKK